MNQIRIYAKPAKLYTEGALHAEPVKLYIIMKVVLDHLSVLKALDELIFLSKYSSSSVLQFSDNSF